MLKQQVLVFASCVEPVTRSLGRLNLDVRGRPIGEQRHDQLAELAAGSRFELDLQRLDDAVGHRTSGSGEPWNYPSVCLVHLLQTGLYRVSLANGLRPTPTTSSVVLPEFLPRFCRGSRSSFELRRRLD